VDVGDLCALKTTPLFSGHCSSAICQQLRPGRKATVPFPLEFNNDMLDVSNGQGRVKKGILSVSSISHRKAPDHQAKSTFL
jgi:hypothetical protein